jgi:23S rRNA pseudouridine2605 synthase
MKEPVKRDNQNNELQEPLLKVLVSLGLGSRRQMVKAIQQQRVSIDGRVAESFSHPVSRQSNTISFDGRPVQWNASPDILLMLNKPAGVLCTTMDERGRRTIMDILPQKYRQSRLYPVGRLDKNSTGLLLLTNDGNLTYHLTHPRFEKEKEYLVQINGRLTPHEKNSIEKGIFLDDGMTYPATVKEHKAYAPFNYSITIHEGRKRQVRRMFEKLGYRVIALKRIRIGGLYLGELKEGEVRELTAQEKIKLLESAV